MEGKGEPKFHSQLGSYWQLIASRRDRQFSLGSVTSGHIPGQAPYPRVFGQHKLDSMGLRKRHREGI